MNSSLFIPTQTSIISDPQKTKDCQTVTNPNSIIRSQHNQIKFQSSFDDRDECNRDLLNNRHLKLRQQEDRIQVLKKQIEILVNENRTLKNQNIRQAKQLVNLDQQSTNVPRMLEHLEMEMRSLKNQLKNVKSSLQNEQRIRKEAEAEVYKLKQALYKSKELIAEKGLEEKHEIKKHMDEALDNLKSKDALLKENQNKLEMLDKNYKMEMLNLQRKVKMFSDKSEDLENKYIHMQEKLKEKERLLEIQNIYTKRFNFPTGKLSEETFLCDSCLTKWTLGKLVNKEYMQKWKVFDDKIVNKQVTSVLTKQIGHNTYDRSRILEDIRNLIQDEIRSGRFTICYNLPGEENQRNIEASSVEQLEKIIDSPHLESDYFECNKLTITNNDDKTDDTEESIVTQAAVIEVICTETTKEKKDDEKMSEIDKVNKDEKESSHKQLINESDENRNGFKRTNNKDMIIPDNSYLDSETISILEKMCTVTRDHSDKIKKVIPLQGTVLNNNDNLFSPIEKTLKLPKVIKEDVVEFKQHISQRQVDQNQMLSAATSKNVTKLKCCIENSVSVVNYDKCNTNNNNYTK